MLSKSPFTVSAYELAFLFRAPNTGDWSNCVPGTRRVHTLMHNYLPHQLYPCGLLCHAEQPLHLEKQGKAQSLLCSTSAPQVAI